MTGGDSKYPAWIDGVAAPFDAAATEAARLLEASAAPVFAHLGADVEGAREAVLLAERIGAALDHAASAALIADLDPVRETGAMLTTPLEAAVRADVALFVGPYAGDLSWLGRPARPQGEDIARTVISLAAAAPAPGALVHDAGEGAHLLAFLATLRARVKGRSLAVASPAIDTLAAALRGAKFGVALWSAAGLEPLAIEAIHGLVRDLNETTRFSTLAAPAPDHGLGVQNVCGWMTGFPLRTGFARGRPEHDPWRYDARRLVAAGETDCLIWVSAFDGGAAPPAGAAIAVCAPGAPAAARVSFAAARPGVESDAILFDAGVGTFVALCASAASPAPSVGEILSAIRLRLGAC
jgi:formylmethanofuran dehydrogenase subunit B